MWILNWLWSVLDYLGLSQKNGKLLIIGLDNAGKTTLLRVLRDNLIIQHSPTPKANCEKLSLGGVQFTAFDLGGHPQMRRVWRDYFFAVDALVYIIDVADKEKMEASRDELVDILADQIVADIPILVLGNKIDKVGALGEEEIKKFFKLPRTGVNRWRNGKGENQLEENIRPLELFMCSITGRCGYGNAFKWLSKNF